MAFLTIMDDEDQPSIAKVAALFAFILCDGIWDSFARDMQNARLPTLAEREKETRTSVSLRRVFSWA